MDAVRPEGLIHCVRLAVAGGGIDEEDCEPKVGVLATITDMGLSKKKPKTKEEENR